SAPHVQPLQAHFLGQFHSPDFGTLAPPICPSLGRAAWHKGCKPPGVDRNAMQSTTFRASSPCTVHLSSSSFSSSSSIGWLGYEEEDDDEHEDKAVHGPNASAKAERGFP